MIDGWFLFEFILVLSSRLAINERKVVLVYQWSSHQTLLELTPKKHSSAGYLAVSSFKGWPDYS